MATTIPTPAPAANRGMILASIMAATVMTALDTTIANVALPHMAGSVSASADQITWVLTSYIITTAIMTPTTGWLAGRFGAKTIFLVSIIGFTLSSALCGAAQSLSQIVLFRLLQGLFGGTLMPMSQAVILDTYPLEERGPALAVWGMGTMVAPIIGPALGGWLTDNFEWRWVFYINLPIGALSLVGILMYVKSSRAKEKRRFDITGFALLSIVLASFQLLLDRGSDNDWFHSSETILEASIAAVAFLMFLIHSTLSEHPFIPLDLFKDGNFTASLLFGTLTSVMIFSVLALLPTMMETLLGYPVVTTGLLTAPRGVGSLISMFIAGRIVGKVDTRLILSIGIVLFSIAFFEMSHFDLQMDSRLILVSGLVQGFGTGLLFMPLSTLAFGTLNPALRGDGAGVYTLSRSLGQSIGISAIQALYTRTVPVVHARLASAMTPFNPAAKAPYLAAPYSLTNPVGAAALNGEITRQASMVSYIDIFHLMFLTTISMLPFVWLLRSGKAQGAAVPVMEH